MDLLDLRAISSEEPFGRLYWLALSREELQEAWSSRSRVNMWRNKRCPEPAPGGQFRQCSRHQFHEGPHISGVLFPDQIDDPEILLWD